MDTELPVFVRTPAYREGILTKPGSSFFVVEQTRLPKLQYDF